MNKNKLLSSLQQPNLTSLTRNATHLVKEAGNVQDVFPLQHKKHIFPKSPKSLISPRDLSHQVRNVLFFAASLAHIEAGTIYTKCVYNVPVTAFRKKFSLDHKNIYKLPVFGCKSYFLVTRTMYTKFACAIPISA